MERLLEFTSRTILFLCITDSAHWCPPCRRFTPLLRKAYLDAVAAGKEFEVVFVSCDQNQVGFDEYFATMPWKAIPFEDADRRDKLSNTFGIHGIPALLLMDEHGVFNEEGREAVTMNPNGFPRRN